MEPKGMTKSSEGAMTAKEKVLKVHPKAFLTEGDSNIWAILSEEGEFAQTLAEANTQEAAWQNAAELSFLRASVGGEKWIEIKEGCEMPKEYADILYVIKNRGSSPYVVKGQRCYETNQGWWWCDEGGCFSDVGNDPGFSVVTHWQPLPDPPSLPNDKE